MFCLCEPTSPWFLSKYLLSKFKTLGVYPWKHYIGYSPESPQKPLEYDTPAINKFQEEQIHVDSFSKKYQ
jgi:hypothetical protein